MHKKVISLVALIFLKKVQNINRALIETLSLLIEKKYMRNKQLLTLINLGSHYRKLNSDLLKKI